MKQLVIINNVSLNDEVSALLTNLGIAEFTRFTRCTGTGNITGARHDDHIWPGYNVMTVCVVDDGLASKAMKALQEFRNTEQAATTGIYAYTIPVDSALAPPESLSLKN